MGTSPLEQMPPIVSAFGPDKPALKSRQRVIIWQTVRSLYPILVLTFSFATATAFGQQKPASWHGMLRDAAGKPVPRATVELQAVKLGAQGLPPESSHNPTRAGQGIRPDSGQTFTTTTDQAGVFSFLNLPPGPCSVSVHWQGHTVRLAKGLEIHEGETLTAWLNLSEDSQQLTLQPASAQPVPGSSGGERLSSREVASLPLNKRDFSQLLLLAAGTMTDTNGAANFTQQFAVNGQRGTTAVFAMDGIYTSDPELGGATFANFNVDAIQEIQSSSGVMPAEVGQGAAGFTNVVTKSGGEQVHGAVFEFVRNAAFDARNFFDRRSIANPGRIPPFARNEFGLTNGGPIVLPGLYDGRKRTYYFGQYQGFRQVLGTTQVLAVPTPGEHQGIDSTAFPGDALFVPVNPLIAPVLARYPLPDDPKGAYGARTFATSSKVATISNQFSLRIDHRISEKAQLFARFNFNNVTGPTTNPNQTVIDPSFAIRFFDHQRNFGLTYTRAVSPSFVLESFLGVLRSTPFFPPLNHTQPALLFGDGLYEPFNSPGGTVIGSHGNLFQAAQNFTYTRGPHTLKMGAEARFNRDTGVFAYGPNGTYTFGGGTAYAQVAIPSASGLHNIRVGDPLPDSLTGFLTATPFSFTTETDPPQFGTGDKIAEGELRREAYNFYLQDSWKVSPRLTVDYGLRYEFNTPIHEARNRASNVGLAGPNGQPARFWDPGVRLEFLFNPQPTYEKDLRGWGPRLALDWRASDQTVLRAGGAITTILSNIFQSNFLTSGIPFLFPPYVSATPGTPIPFQNSVVPINFPQVFTTSGQPLFANPDTAAIPANTEMDIERFERDLGAAIPGHQFQSLYIYGTSRDFRNGYLENFTAGIDRDFRDVKLSAAYVGAAGVKLGSILFPNGYGGAAPGFAPFTRFDAGGNVVGGIGPMLLLSNRSHSTYHSFQSSLQKTSPRAGLGFQLSYTFSKTLDDTSNVFGGFGSGSGPALQTFPQNPRNPGAEKGPSTFDLRHTLVFSVIQALPFDRPEFTRRLGRRFTSGWQLLNISTLASGPPFSVISGVQQTGDGSPSLGPDRPDQLGLPLFSTSRIVREDYFGQEAGNTAFFFIPIHVPGGTGPNQGRFGTLGRNTFRGPAFHNFDVALIKDTTFGRRGNTEALTLEFRSEFFNAFNLVNFGVPGNIVRGTGFGLISRTAGTSRQVQISLKLIY